MRLSLQKFLAIPKITITLHKSWKLSHAQHRKWTDSGKGKKANSAKKRLYFNMNEATVYSKVLLPLLPAVQLISTKNWQYVNQYCHIRGKVLIIQPWYVPQMARRIGWWSQQRWGGCNRRSGRWTAKWARSIQVLNNRYATFNSCLEKQHAISKQMSSLLFLL